MRAVTFLGPLALEVAEVAEPSIEVATDVIVRVELAGICGSDLHPYRGHEVGLDEGTVLGHEFVGEVVAVGAEVHDLPVGTIVVSPFSTSCGRCFNCRRGLTARCERGELFGWVEEGRGLHGAQAEYVRVPLADSTLVQLPEGAEVSAASLFAGDILSTGLFAAHSGNVGAATAVTVLGCGPVGLMSVLASAERGASDVWAVDSVPERLELAATCGAVPVDLAQDPIGAIRRDGHGPDVVIDAVGSPEATRLAYDIVRPGGVIVAVGVHTEASLAITPGELYDKNLDYRAGRSSARTYIEEALRLGAANRNLLGSIVSHTMSLEDAVKAYDMFDKRRDGTTKILLVP